MNTSSPLANVYYMQASKFFDDTKYQDAVDAFGDALLKSNTHTEVYKALTKYGYSFPEEKVNYHICRQV